MKREHVMRAAGLEQGQSWSGSEKRYLPRWEVDSRVICRRKNDETPHECRTVDLSCSGACLVSREDFSRDRRVCMDIFLSPKTAVQMEGYVVWSKAEEYGHVLGIHFDTATEASQELILQYAFEVNKTSLVKHWFEGWNEPKK